LRHARIVTGTADDLPEYADEEEDQENEDYCANTDVHVVGVPGGVGVENVCGRSATSQGERAREDSNLRPTD
jgi:hypothetical protein